MKLLKIAISLLVFPLIAVAQTSSGFECTMGEHVRRVIVERNDSGPVICEVAYYKDTESPGVRQALWNAENDASYCEDRLAEFAEKLEGWGWTCVVAAPASRD